MTTRKSYLGGAVPTSISSGTFGVGATTLTLTVTTGWPTTTNGPFVATIDRGLATQEKILIASRTGVTCSAITRGYDGTSEVGHGSNASIEHCLDAITLDEANRLSSLLTTKGDDLGHDGTQVQRLAVGAAGTYLTATPAAATGKSWTAPTPPVVTTKGDLETFSTVPARLAVGADYSVLEAAAGQVTGMRWRKPSVLVWRRVPQDLQLTGSAVTTISWDTEDLDTGSIGTPGTSFTLTTGVWTVGVRITTSAALTSNSILMILGPTYGHYAPCTSASIDTGTCQTFYLSSNVAMSVQVNNRSSTVTLMAATLTAVQLLGQ